MKPIYILFMASIITNAALSLLCVKLKKEIGYDEIIRQYDVAVVERDRNECRRLINDIAHGKTSVTYLQEYDFKGNAERIKKHAPR